ncbi:hypothetical protein [Sphingomonas sp. Leaf67]|uniref:hypothetical protein n=1 Tax=Sphingomonas sp. Leaf67 TaxID=1736230 RepID=UPI000ADD8F75|nr:hypothetical protein [Sphingomonas sp. Leaf67]
MTTLVTWLRYPGRCGSPQMTRENGLRRWQKRGGVKRTTDREHAWPVASNTIGQDFTTTAPDRK